MWGTVCLLTVLVCGVLGAPSAPCPERCICTSSSDGFQLDCSSFDFLQKPLLPKQIASIATLTISNRSLITIDPKLKNLKNLKTLNLSHNSFSDLSIIQYLTKLQRLNLKFNHVRKFTASQLPESLEYLDLSNNHITDIPQDWLFIPNLKQLNLSKNFLSCTCDSLTARDMLIKSGVNLVKPITCRSPKEYKGMSWLSASCVLSNDMNLFGEMQGDEAFGSGSGESGDNFGNSSDNKNVDKDYIPVTEISLLTDSSETEGSGEVPQFIFTDRYATSPSDEDGDEEYDEGTTIPTDIEIKRKLEHGRFKACHFDCSTPEPIDEFSATALETEETTTESVQVEIKESIERKVNPRLDLSPKKEAETISFSATPTDGKLDKVVEQKKAEQSNSTFIFLAVLLLAMVGLVVYAVYKKRSIRRNLRQANESNAMKKVPSDVEMKLIPKQNVPPPKLPTNGSTPETVPLINGQNGTQSKKPEEETEVALDEGTPMNGPNNEVELRDKPDQALLTPEAKRVVIKASELPDSVPRTPLLVNRHLSSDGRNIITTPTTDQRR